MLTMIITNRIIVLTLSYLKSSKELSIRKDNVTSRLLFGVKNILWVVEDENSYGDALIALPFNIR